MSSSNQETIIVGSGLGGLVCGVILAKEGHRVTILEKNRQIGGMLQIGGSLSEPSVILGALAVLVATINVAGGFLVTQRMLKMFHR